MTKQLLGILFFATLLTSCDLKKSYKYVEIVEEAGILGGIEKKEKEPKTISASSDSAAYLDAYRSFCISLKVNKDMKQSLGKVYSTPIKFKLLDNKDQDITSSIFFSTKEKREKEIEENIFSMRNTLQETVDNSKKEKIEDFKQSAKIDSFKIKELSKYFVLRKDEFSNNNLVWYKPKSAPQYANQNGLYCYFQTENGMPSNLRFKFQYYSDDWLFFSKIQFAIDGKAFEYIPSDTETDSGDGGHIWEWFDQGLTQSDKDLIFALANAKSAKMKIVGRQYYDTKEITQGQILSIKRTLDLYNALGGQY